MKNSADSADQVKASEKKRQKTSFELSDRELFLQDAAPTADERAGMDWWKLDEAGRRDWMQQAGNTGRVADAWKAYKRNRWRGREEP
ncbi:hypothetical protein NKG95_24035 [Mesorhizobium sp. M1423]|uniref:hypothetical protein n=1 Tax=Mesorhizobium sp. M1423 TaxID=2957101 RepID=UPI00333C5781